MMVPEQGARAPETPARNSFSKARQEKSTQKSKSAHADVAIATHQQGIHKTHLNGSTGRCARVRILSDKRAGSCLRGRA